MSDEEMNSAELEAEQILKDAYPEARAEACPRGDECSVHFRKDSVDIDEGEELALLVSYVGDYCVITDDNQERQSAQILLGIALGILKEKDIPPRWRTSVHHVGAGVLGDLAGTSEEVRLEAYRYHWDHDRWADVQAEHRAVVTAIECDFIDVSKPFNWEK